MDFETVARKVLSGGEVTEEEALWLLKHADRNDLHELAHRVTLRFAPRTFDFCAIISARQGWCGENCKWCAQSAHWKTACEAHGWIGSEKCVEAAERAQANGANRIAIVTSGRAQSEGNVGEICEALREMRSRTKIHLCGSLGLMNEADMAKLKDAGLERYHCNIETAPSHFGALCTTHTFQEKLATLKAAKRLGLQICCGGIIGMGETDEQLVEFAFALKEIAPDSIPVNILHPIAGTPLGESGIMPIAKVLDDISILRIVNPSTSLRFAGGRRDMSDDDARKAIYVGMSAGIAGPLLTTPGANYADDRALAEEAGYRVVQDMRTVQLG